MQEIEGQPEDRVHAQELSTFQPVRFSVHRDQGRHAGRDGDRHDFERKDEIRGVRRGTTRRSGPGDEERDLMLDPTRC
jgi:hypothetical protein